MKIDKCRLCELGITTNPVNGKGDEQCDIMFVTDNPNYYDSRNGFVLSGSIGDTFDKLLKMVTLERKDIYTTSLIKCKPTTNIKVKNVLACKSYLQEEINTIRPKIIVTMGRHSFKTITKRTSLLSNNVQKAIKLPNGIYVVPMYSLIYILNDVRNHKIAVQSFINLYKLYRVAVNPAIANREQELHKIVKQRLNIPL